MNLSVFLKSADSPPLADYQQRAIERILSPDSKGLMLAHGVGTGKTRSAIEAAKQLGQSADVVVPAALIPNWKRELNKWEAGSLPVTFYTLEKLQRDPTTPLNSPTLIVDEVHRIRNARKAYQALKKSPALKKIFLSGTPMINKPSDLLPPLKLISKDPKLRVSGAAFNTIIDDAVADPAEDAVGKLTPEQRKTNYKALDEPAKRVMRKQIINTLQKYVDAHTVKTQDMPSVTTEDVLAKANKRQSFIQSLLRGKIELNLDDRQKFLETLSPDRQDLNRFRAFRIGERQLANGDPGMMHGQTSPKMNQAVKNFIESYKKNKKHKAIIYSNFVRSGLDLYKKQLAKEKIPYGEFSGAIDKKERDQVIKDYNADKLNALLISSAGAEGLDLKGTNAVHIIDPHFNESRSQQAMARGIRKGSHNHLPPDLRKVHVLRYYLDNPADETADVILNNMANNKQKSINYLLETLNNLSKKEQ
jgi:SNF2 family DNA or RNA helicase